MTIDKNDTILATWAHPANGPGWANAPVCVLVRHNGMDKTEYRVEWIQPSEQNAEMLTLYDVSAAVNEAMNRAAEQIARRQA